MEKTVCIYHGNCFDGIAAAWVVKQKYPNAEFIPANYGDTKLINNIQQDCFENANINYHYILVDFSLPRDLMIQMSNKAKSIIVIDHHKTAQKDCEGLDFCIFNMKESGASLAWRHYFGHLVPSLYIQYTKDRDLWINKLLHTKEIQAYIQSYEIALENCQMFRDKLEFNFKDCVTEGTAILRYMEAKVKQICAQAKITKIEGYTVPVVNSGPLLMSEVGHELCKEYPYAAFSAYYFDRADGIRQYGLRSIGEFDVSEIAKKFGGGGHKNAAGFQITIVSLDKLGD